MAQWQLLQLLWLFIVWIAAKHFFFSPQSNVNLFWKQQKKAVVLSYQPLCWQRITFKSLLNLPGIWNTLEDSVLEWLSLLILYIYALINMHMYLQYNYTRHMHHIHMHITDKVMFKKSVTMFIGVDFIQSTLALLTLSILS